MKSNRNSSKSILALANATRLLLAGALLSTSMLATGCGESADAPAVAETKTQKLFDSDLVDSAPYTLKSNAAGGLYLQCNTGADIAPHTLDPANSAELSLWLQECLAELGFDQGGPMSSALIDRCVDQTVNRYDNYANPDRPFTGAPNQNKADIRDIRSTAGRFWYCTADIAGFDNPLPMPNENSAAFREACKAAGAEPRLIVMARINEVAKVEALDNPCPKIDFNNPKQDKGGLIYECASNNQVISQIATHNFGGLESVRQHCPGQEITEKWIGGTNAANDTTIYGCTAHGETLAHSDGLGAFLKFEAVCSELGGRAYSREFSLDTAGPEAEYLCTANGNRTSSIASVDDFKRERASCALLGGSILTTDPAAMRTGNTVGRDGRGDKVAPAREPHKGVDQHGNLYVICMPGADITECANQSEFKAAWHDCINSGRQPVVWSPHSTVDSEDYTVSE